MTLCGLMSRWTIPLRCEKRKRGEDLARVVDRDRDRRAGPRATISSFRRRPVEELHRDVVRALGLAAVVDRDDVRVRQARRRSCASRRKRSTNCSSPAWRSLRILIATLPAERLVLGEVDVRHAAGAELSGGSGSARRRACRSGCRRRPSAYRLGFHSGTGAPAGSASRSARPSSPPVPRWCSSATATATFGLSAGAKAMNQVVFTPACPVSAVPVLPATAIAGDLRRRAGAAGHDRLHHRRRAARPSRGEIGAPSSCGLRSRLIVSVRARRSARRRCGCMTTPPFATAAATIAIWSGVTEQALLAEREPARVDRRAASAG